MRLHRWLRKVHLRWCRLWHRGCRLLRREAWVLHLGHKLALGLRRWVCLNKRLPALAKILRCAARTKGLSKALRTRRVLRLRQQVVARRLDKLLRLTAESLH